MDSYSIKARLYPSILVLLPLFITAVIYITDFEKYYHYITAIISLGVFTYLLSQLGRDLGKKKEPELFKFWSGKPSVILLRHSDNHLDWITKERYYRILSNNIPGIHIPTKDEEKNNPENANQVYESCTKFLISKTRDHNKYQLLHKEKTDYGFRRNLWGMKTWGIIFIIVCLLVHTILATDSFKNFNIKPDETLLYVFYFSYIFFWILIVTKEWIKIPAYAYAERLLEALNNL